MKNYSISLLVFANYCLIFGYRGSEGYTFLIRHYETLNVVQPNHAIPWEKFSPNMNAEDRHYLCRQAIEKAELDMVKDPPAHEIMNYIEVNKKFIHLIRCRTVPTAYLHFGSSKDIIIIAMEKNKYIDHKFLLKMINSPPIPCSKMLEKDPQYLEVGQSEFEKVVDTVCVKDRILTMSHIIKFRRNQDRIHLCTAAKHFLQETDDEPSHGVLPVFQNDRLDTAEIYYGDKEEDGREKHYAIRCSTVPDMYLYFQNLRISTALQILLVASSAK